MKKTIMTQDDSAHLFGPFRQAGAFTLIELLVVISIISLLISILSPALGSARQAARSLQCLAQLHQFGVSMHSYRADNKDAFPDYGTTNAKSCWDYKLVDYVNYSDGTTNHIYRCPEGQVPSSLNVATARGYAMNHYVANWKASLAYAGNGGLGEAPRDAEQMLLTEAWNINSYSDLVLFGSVNNSEYLDFFPANLPKLAFRHQSSTMNFLKKDGSATTTDPGDSGAGEDILWLYYSGKWWRNGAYE